MKPRRRHFVLDDEGDMDVILLARPAGRDGVENQRGSGAGPAHPVYLAALGGNEQIGEQVVRSCRRPASSPHRDVSGHQTAEQTLVATM